MTNNYERSAQREYELARRLRGQGYTGVRSAGSHGPVDLVAWDGNGTRFIQVKADRTEALAAGGEVWWGSGKTWHHRVVSST